MRRNRFHILCAGMMVIPADRTKPDQDKRRRDVFLGDTRSRWDTASAVRSKNTATKHNFSTCEALPAGGGYRFREPGNRPVRHREEGGRYTVRDLPGGERVRFRVEKRRVHRCEHREQSHVAARRRTIRRNNPQPEKQRHRRSWPEGERTLRLRTLRNPGRSESTVSSAIRSSMKNSTGRIAICGGGQGECDKRHRVGPKGGGLRRRVLPLGNRIRRFSLPEHKAPGEANGGCGADIILGHHPHVPQGVEKSNNSIIFYAWGTFCSTSSGAAVPGNPLSRRSESRRESEYELSPVKINERYQVELMDDKRSKNTWNTWRASP